MTMRSSGSTVPRRRASVWLVVLDVLFVAGIFAFIAAAALKFANESLWNPLARMRADDIVKSLPTSSALCAWSCYLALEAAAARYSP